MSKDRHETVLDEYLRRYLSLKQTASPAMRYQMYGLYMQATQGDCYAPKPPKEEQEARLKWKAWHNVRHLTRADAQRHFIEKVRSLDQLNMIRVNSGPDLLSVPNNHIK